jgi:hypothetical protein
VCVGVCVCVPVPPPLTEERPDRPRAPPPPHAPRFRGFPVEHVHREAQGGPKPYPPAVAWAEWSGRCWLRAQHFRAALLVLC